MDMENWLTLAILSAFFSGLANFTYKFASQKNHHVELLTAYTSLVTGTIALSIYIFQGGPISNYTSLIIIATISAIAHFISITSRIKSLKYIDSTIFFPLQKTLGPILIISISTLFFSESLSSREIIAIGIGMLVPILLIQKSEGSRQKNLKKGLALLLTSTSLGVVASASSKYTTNNAIDTLLFISISSYIVSIIGFINFHKYKQDHNHSHLRLKTTALIAGTLSFGSFYCFIKSTAGNLAIAYTINSFSILIPIVLSIIFYKEHFNIRKAIVLTISITSVLLLK